MTVAQRLHALSIALLVTSCAAQEAPPPQTAAPAPPAPGPANRAASEPVSPAPTAASNPEPVTARPATPDAIATPPSETVVLKVLGKGVQIYACKPKDGAPTTFEWTLKAPEADLFDDKGKKIGKHYAGPTWEAADGSKVVGRLKAKVDAPEASAIPWLLLEAKSNEGDGVLARVKAIQRIATVGGKAPAAGCNAAHAGAEARVDYTATYYMYGP